MQAYWNAVEQLGKQLIALLAEALGLDVEAFLKLFDKPMLFLRPLHYSARRSVPDQVSNVCNSLKLSDVSRPLHCRPICKGSCAGTGHASTGKLHTD